MRVKAAWKVWKADRSPDAGAVLERRYAHIPEAGDALTEFRGRPGQFAEFARRRALSPPDLATPPLAVADLSADLAPVYPARPRLYTPALPVEKPGRAEPQEPTPPRPTGYAMAAAEACPAPPARAGRATPPSVAPPAAGEAVPPTSTRTTRGVTASTAGPPRTRAPRPVAAVQALKPWSDALAVVHRVSRPDTDRTIGTIRLEVCDGFVRLFGRDGSRAHWASVPAKTSGTACVALDRADLLLREWRQSGRLSLFEGWLCFEPAGGGVHWAPAVPTAMPPLPDEPGCAGVVLHRDDLRDGLREALSHRLFLSALPDEIRLFGDAGRLVVEARDRGTVALPVTYLHGALDVRLSPRWALEAVACCPSPELVLEATGHWAPLRVSSGWFDALIAVRSPESYL